MDDYPAAFALRCLSTFIDHVTSCFADACNVCTPADVENVRRFLAALDALREEGPPPCPSP